jgi:hypothetical protein
MVIFTVPHVPWNLKQIPVPKAHIPELVELLKQKMEMGILELMVYCAQEERNATLHSRLAAGQQGDHSERRNRADHRQIRGGLRRKVDLLGRRPVHRVRPVSTGREEQVSNTGI